MPLQLRIQVINNDIKNYEDWKYPLQINISNKRLIEVRIEVIDKIRKKIKSKIIDIKSIDSTNNNNDDDNDYTEIIIYIPTNELNYNGIIDSVFK